MALNTTPGSATADSYATLADALAYHAAIGNAAWSASTVTDTQREAALRRATAWLDGRYDWPGYRVNGRLQALDWPRHEAYDTEDEIIDYTTIPDEVVNATCEAALRELASPGSLSPDVTPGTMKVLTEVKGIRWTQLRGGASESDMAPTLLTVDRILSHIIGGGGRQTRLARA